MQVGDSKFVKTKFDSLDGKTVVAETTEDNGFSIKADRSGVTLDGRFTLTSMAELQEFAKLVSAQWAEHTRLKPKLHKNLSGH